ncbi:MAG: DNA gyrase inhibitor YacG [Blastocatellia bacterium]|nr:DNA gyrase inhibitor YacG [Blastocatellia bacterium]
MKCPICGKETTWENNPTRPFCSERCQTIDLGNWASEEYHMPASAPEQLENIEEIEN